MLEMSLYSYSSARLEQTETVTSLTSRKACFLILSDFFLAKGENGKRTSFGVQSKGCGKQ
jgi:hypothetical protein